jgi:hypothetical protein
MGSDWKIRARRGFKKASNHSNPAHPFLMILTRLHLAVMTASLLAAHTTIVAASASGPLRAGSANPRYFVDGHGKLIYLTGAHTWANLQDQGAIDPPPKFDYDRYLDFMRRHNHNFMRLWAWEQARWAPWSDGKAPNPDDWFIQPNPYSRSGPGLALDGKPKFDLATFDEAYFTRLRERVRKAGRQGIYVSVMLFQGWSCSKGGLAGKPFPGHPYHPSNNIQGFNGDPKSNQGPDLNDKAVRDLQAAYIRKVVETVNDLDNVLYEVTNEGGNKEWDWWVVNFVHDYEKTKPKQHPVGLTGHGSESNADLLASPADWISPGANDWPDLRTEPRAVDGKKISLLDTDHVFGVGGDRQWVWKGFLRGHNVLFMDPYDDPQFTGILEAQKVGTPFIEAARQAMGQSRKFAQRMNLAAATPRPELASSGYCLADPGVEYLVYQPGNGESFTVELKPGKYRCEWLNPANGTTVKAKRVESWGARQSFKAPFPGDSVLYLRAD